MLARELLEVERVAAAGLVDRAADGAGDAGAEQGLGVGEGERAEGVLDHGAVALGGGERGGEQRAHGRGAEGEREQDAAARRSSQQRRDELQRRVVGPVEVVEDDHHRLARGEPSEQGADGAVGAVALVLQAGGHAADGGDDRGELRQLVADQPLQPVDAEERGVVGERVLPDAERAARARARRRGRAARGGRSARAVSSSSRRVLPIPPSPLNAITAPWRWFESLQRLVDCRQLRAPSEDGHYAPNLTARHPVREMARIHHQLSPPKVRHKMQFKTLAAAGAAAPSPLASPRAAATTRPARARRPRPTAKAAATPVATIPALTGKDTAVTLDAGFVKALGDLKLTPAPVGTAEISKAGVASVPDHRRQRDLLHAGHRVPVRAGHDRP